MELLTPLVDFFAQSGYFAVFAALIICGLGVPLPEDITLIAGGVIAGLGYANVHNMVLVAMVGVLSGDLIMFSLGSYFGPQALARWPLAQVVKPKRFAKVQELFDKYGNRMLFAARFLPGLRAAVFLTAGMTHRVSVWRFLALDGLAAVISVPLWVYLGYVGANNNDLLLKWLHGVHVGFWILFAILAVGLIGFWWRCRQRKQRLDE